MMSQLTHQPNPNPNMFVSMLSGYSTLKWSKVLHKLCLLFYALIYNINNCYLYFSHQLMLQDVYSQYIIVTVLKSHQSYHFSHCYMYCYYYTPGTGG